MSHRYITRSHTCKYTYTQTHAHEQRVPIDTDKIAYTNKLALIYDERKKCRSVLLLLFECSDAQRNNIIYILTDTRLSVKQMITIQLILNFRIVKILRMKS